MHLRLSTTLRSDRPANSSPEPNHGRGRRLLGLRGRIGLCILLITATVATLSMTAPAAAQAGPGGGNDPGAGDALAVELGTQLERLLTAVRTGERAVIDELTCLDDLLAARLRREEALGLLRDAGDPSVVETRRRAARADLVVSFGDLLARGGRVVAVDASRVEVLDGPEAVADEDLPVAGDQRRTITGTGLLGVELARLQRPIDLGVQRLDARWCIDPLSLP
ncbi:MAG: hypothetical protein AAGC60_24985 [Acidobacteriota bacterium]